MGAFGLLLPVAVAFYYVYIQSWTLAYTYYALRGTYAGITSRKAWHSSWQTSRAQTAWGVSGVAYVCFVLTMAINTWILYGGVRQGIERVATWGMPVLIALSILLAVRVLTLGAPDPSYPEQSGMGWGFCGIPICPG